MIKHQDTSNIYCLPMMNHMTVCAVIYVTCRISVMFTLTSFGLVFSLWHNPAYLFENISLHFCQGPDNTDVFMVPVEDDNEQIAEEVLKESKIIQAEIKSLLSEVYLVDVGFCLVLFCIILLIISLLLKTNNGEKRLMIFILLNLK